VRPLPLRIAPGKDLRAALESELQGQGGDAAFVIAGTGSLAITHLRFAGAQESTIIEGPVEILTLTGTLSRDGAHLHMSVADAQGHVFGGHVAQGCTVRTTAEVLIVLLPEWSFAREPDPVTGYRELVVRLKG
jgi:predicted DNA-binding protein with PD1-like motif